MSALFLQGNSRDVLKGLPADYFHVCMTSPPYFGLRKYDGGEEIWDGDPDCQHEWVDSSLPKSGGVGDYEVGRVGNAKARTGSHDVKKSDTCHLCGAWKGALGNEPTPELYLRHLVEICREVRRVLRPDGVFFLNIGDSWAGGKGQSGGASPERQDERHKSGESLNRSADQLTAPKATRALDDRKALRESGIKPLDMVLIPEQLALALRADGWYLRSILIWAKGVSLSDEYNGNPMPESVNGWRWERHKVRVKARTRGSNDGSMPPQSHHAGQVPHRDGSFDTPSDTVWQDCPGCPKCEKNGGYVLRKGSWRATDSYEHILMLTKTNSYFCDREAVLESYSYTDPRSEKGLSRLVYGGKGNPEERAFSGGASWLGHGNGNGGRNLRSVLLVPTTGYKGAHFAVYNPKLIEPLIKAATSEKGCCPKCGSPWARVIDRVEWQYQGQSGKDNDIGAEGSPMYRGGERNTGLPYRSLSYNSKYKEGDVTGLATQGFQRNETIEGERSQSRIDAERLFPDDERKQQDYINHIHDHGGLDKGRTIGWLPTCSCGIQETESCRILDPFSGAGTTALVCERLELDSINIDTSAEYIHLAEARISGDEQKRIDEQIKQLRKEAKLATKNG